MGAGNSKPPEATRIKAGRFGAWLSEIEAALSSDKGTDVPCGDCVGCCTSSLFIHIGPNERDTLDRIPKALLFPAPRMPKGHVLMGYGSNGHCPMFLNGRCSIYQHRPNTCRTFDCRVFPATGVTPDPERRIIADRATRWEFEFSDNDENNMRACQLAAEFLRTREAELPAGTVPRNPSQISALAIRLRRSFINSDGSLTYPSTEDVSNKILDLVPAAGA